MGNFRSRPYKNDGVILVSVKELDGKNPDDKAVFKLYNNVSLDKLISIDLRKISYTTVNLLVTGKINSNRNCNSAVVRFDSVWTNYSTMKVITEKESRDSYDYFQQEITLSKTNISGKCELRIEYLDNAGQIIEQSKIFFIQSDGRSGPDFKDGLFDWKHSQFHINEIMNESIVEGLDRNNNWLKIVDELSGLKNLFAIEITENKPILIRINDSVPGNIADVSQISEKELTINNLLYLIMGYGPFLIEVFRIYLKIMEIINEQPTNYLSNGLLIEEKKVNLRDILFKRIQDLGEYESKKIFAIAGTIFPNKKNSPEGPLVHFAELSHAQKFNELMQKATTVYQSKLFSLDKKISNDLMKLREIVRESIQGNIQ